MNYFHYVGRDLACEKVPLERIAKEYGTPTYVYSHRTLERHWKVFDGAFGKTPRLVCFSVKANPNLAILRTFAAQGAGADIVSGGELVRALKVGVDPKRIVFSGVGKTEEEMALALRHGILMINVESHEELLQLQLVAARAKAKAPIALRVNPDIDARTHPHISTGLKKNKFGIESSRCLEEYKFARTLANVEIVGVSTHIGSQITEVGPFIEAGRRIRSLVRDLAREGIAVRYVDMGGGLGITYSEETPPSPRQYAQALRKGLGDLKDVTLVLEPGRVLVGNAGILLTRVLYTKRGVAKSFAIVDAGMNDIARPALYGSYHHLLPARRATGPEGAVDVVGPICESTDVLAKDRALPPLKGGDLVAIMSAGAYGISMASSYNTRPLPAEVLVRGERSHLIRRRVRVEDLFREEEIPAFLAPEGKS